MRWKTSSMSQASNPGPSASQGDDHSFVPWPFRLVTLFIGLWYKNKTWTVNDYLLRFHVERKRNVLSEPKGPMNGLQACKYKFLKALVFTFEYKFNPLTLIFNLIQRRTWHFNWQAWGFDYTFEYKCFKKDLSLQVREYVQACKPFIGLGQTWKSFIKPDPSLVQFCPSSSFFAEISNVCLFGCSGLGNEIFRVSTLSVYFDAPEKVRPGTTKPRLKRKRPTCLKTPKHILTKVLSQLAFENLCHHICPKKMFSTLWKRKFQRVPLHVGLAASRKW